MVLVHIPYTYRQYDIAHDGGHGFACKFVFPGVNTHMHMYMCAYTCTCAYTHTFFLANMYSQAILFFQFCAIQLEVLSLRKIFFNDLLIKYFILLSTGMFMYAYMGVKLFFI
jgi:hypothetical protein